MDPFFGRVIFALAMTLAGGVLAAWVTPHGEGNDLWVAAGAGAGCAVATLWDRWKGLRVLQWVRERSHERPPAVRGFWAELAYRIEKAIKTERDLLMQEQLKAREFLQAIEASPNGVMLLRSDFRIDWCNQVSADHFGIDPVRDHLQHLTHLVRDPQLVAHIEQAQWDQPVEIPRPRTPGTLSVLFRGYGSGLFLVLSQDVTERDRIEAMRRDFVANVSHEIRTPLTVVAGFLETLCEHTAMSPQDHRRALELMTQQTQRMQSLVADLLSLAELEGSPRPPMDRWHDGQALIQKALSNTQALSAGAHRIVGTDAVAWQVSGDEQELQSAVMNLLTNAVRYTPAGGRIELKFSVSGDGSGHLEVIDNGPGIAREHLPRLTERFYRTDVGRSRASGGTGLGLAIVKHVMQRHGGAVEIESQEGAGSTFRLVLPAYRVQYGSAQQEHT